jgi:predicted transcriptional regulator
MDTRRYGVLMRTKRKMPRTLVMTSVYVDATVRERLRGLARQEDRTLGAEMRRAFTEYLARHDNGGATA